jgi:tight adherence protein C
VIVAAMLFAALAAFSGTRMFAHRPANATGNRLEQIRSNGSGGPADADASSVSDRMIRPLTEWLMKHLAGLLPTRLAHHFEQELLVAGRPMPTQTFLAFQVAGPIGGLALAVELILRAPPPSPAIAFLEVAGCIFFGGALPLYWLKGRSRRRQIAIGRELPDALDLIVVSVEAGLSLEAAMSRTSEDPRSALASEFRRVLADMNLGTGRRTALHGLVTRTRIPAVASLVSAIVQADQTGMGIGQVLRAQSAHHRSQRKQRAEEAAMKAPLKMLFPLILFIFPSLFVVILGPAVLSFITGMPK